MSGVPTMRQMRDDHNELWDEYKTAIRALHDALGHLENDRYDRRVQAATDVLRGALDELGTEAIDP